MNLEEKKTDFSKELSDKFRHFALLILTDKMTLNDWKVLSVMSTALVKSTNNNL